ncbi:MAG: bifunctional diaminohydroxyphosphoribosylaminopyrimidine deaminase/5-amino-6-(5-phosphoribosylamino)uracil reductase RibD [Coxiellaceae bacterium]|nr:bifunctional diaminohydroxyphosphoribosylaminopyrimidine deaminase/5-amino-6-(5-phosphoribosylamino)uracil reductase RibD [Coxiellaceae bacterium]
MTNKSINKHLLRAVNLAQGRLGFTGPNPAVGAVIVKQDQVVAEGCHFQAGEPHAEVMALRAAGDVDLSDATLYVSLQPCCHFGRTPPCTQAIIEAGIKRVYYAYRDSNPEVGSKSDATLEQAGVESIYIDVPEVQNLYRAYDFWRQNKRPFLTAKLAVSRDGKYASQDGSHIGITGEACRRFTHQHRLQADALLTTARTIHFDDPYLNVRLADQVIAKPLLVIDRNLSISPDARVWATAASVTIFHQPEVDDEKRQALIRRGAECVETPVECGSLSWPHMLSHMAEQGYHHVWIEAGARLFCDLWRQRLLQQAFLYVGQKTLGSNAQSAHLSLLVTAEQLAGFAWQACAEDLIGCMQSNTTQA